MSDIGPLACQQQPDSEQFRSALIPWWTWVQKNLEYRQNFMRDVIGQVIATERQDTRAALACEANAIKRELEQQRRELAVSLREPSAGMRPHPS